MIHADNCNLVSDKTCEKSSNSYTYRDYSAIIYLNDDFEGGEFVFAGDFFGEKIQVLKYKYKTKITFFFQERYKT